MKKVTLHQTGPIAKLHAGFTLLEMMIVMAVIAVLLGIGVTLYNSQVTNAKVTGASVFFEREFNLAMTSCHMKFRSYSSCTHAAGSTTSELAKEGLLPLTPWDTSWSSTVSGTTMAITYPLGSGNSAAATDLKTTVSNSRAPHITSATVSGTTVTVNIKMP